ncbi:MAG: hypothetical protein RLZZ385_1491 [Pseudomonadota bacterium]|jgi:outer membrane receptor protein involved in Fe transport
MAKYPATTCSPILLALLSAGIQAQPAPPVEEIVVFGRDTNLVGVASSASQGEVSGADLLVRPMLKVAELLEAMPGMVAVQHSGSGKANQYFLRGFNLDHGTDYTAHVDGLPLNLRSHGHGQGYLDINGLIPESVDSIAYRKGPYYADLGDFALAGASHITTVDVLERNFVGLESGQYGWRRVAGGYSTAAGPGELTVIGEAKTYEGPWQHAEALQHVSLWGKFIVDTSLGTAESTLSIYDGNWHPTEQIPERAIGTPVCADAYCSLDDSADGDTRRWMATTQLTSDRWDASLYAQGYDWAMESNPTYDFQINQFDERLTLGGQANRSLLVQDGFTLDGGVQWRYDDIADVGLSQHADGRFVAPISQNEITEWSLGTYVQGVWSPTERLRILAGLRGDHFDFDVTAKNTASFAGQQTDQQVAPKLGLALLLRDDLEAYGNWGRGFHSNDARGVVNQADPVPGLSTGTGYEAGLRYSHADLKLTAAYWWLDQDSELIFVGDSNSVEPKGGSEREGLELTLFWQPRDWLGIDAVWTDSQARYTDNPEGIWVEGAVENAGQVGISAVRDAWEFSLRGRHLGPYAMTADNSQRAGDLTTVSLRGAWHWQALTLYAEVINLLDNDGKDITYYYEAVVPGLDLPGLSAEDVDCASVGCRMSRATEPRTLRVGASYRF